MFHTLLPFSIFLGKHKEISCGYCSCYLVELIYWCKNSQTWGVLHLDLHPYEPDNLLMAKWRHRAVTVIFKNTETMSTYTFSESGVDVIQTKSSYTNHQNSSLAPVLPQSSISTSLLGNTQKRNDIITCRDAGLCDYDRDGFKQNL